MKRANALFDMWIISHEGENVVVVRRCSFSFILSSILINLSVCVGWHKSELKNKDEKKIEEKKGDPNIRNQKISGNCQISFVNCCFFTINEVFSWCISVSSYTIIKPNNLWESVSNIDEKKECVSHCIR